MVPRTNLRGLIVSLCYLAVKLESMHCVDNARSNPRIVIKSILWIIYIKKNGLC